MTAGGTGPVAARRARRGRRGRRGRRATRPGAMGRPRGSFGPLVPLALAVGVLLAGCGDPGSTDPPVDVNPLDTVPALRELADAEGLGIGSAVGAALHVSAAETYRRVLSEQFNVATPENAMKFGPIHPDPDRYAFDAADSIVAFAERNGMAVRGHTLVWHQQLPGWLTGGSWAAAEADSLLRAHIATVAGRYAGRLVAWDVVNEAVLGDGTLRPGFWADHLGRDYIETAFREAHAADPDAQLFYNDYGIAWLNEKSDSVHAMLAALLNAGVPVHGIGFQAHFEVGRLPASQDLRSNFQRFADLGLTVHVTELDVRIRLPASNAELAQQAADYATVVDACLEVSACRMVVTWGFTDAYSWVPGTFTGWGDALLLDASYEPKPAYWTVHRALGG